MANNFVNDLLHIIFIITYLQGAAYAHMLSFTGLFMNYYFYSKIWNCLSIGMTNIVIYATFH